MDHCATHCEHTMLHHCKRCDMTYCTACRREWRPQYTWAYSQPKSPWTYRSNTTSGGGYTSATTSNAQGVTAHVQHSDAGETTLTEGTCEHGEDPA